MLPKVLPTIHLIALALLLAGCAPRAAAPVPSPTPAPTVPAPATPEPPASAACDPGGGFAIYEVWGVQPFELAGRDLASLVLLAPPLVAPDEIVSYAGDTHRVELVPEAYARLNALRPPATGISFVVCAGGERIYAGAVWPPYSSAGFDGITIGVPGGEPNAIRIALGYPGSDFYTGADPRADPRVVRALGTKWRDR